MKWCVDLMEFESGWGSRLDERAYFDTEEEAKAFVIEFNTPNDKIKVPDWYMVAYPPREVT